MAPIERKRSRKETPAKSRKRQRFDHEDSDLQNTTQGGKAVSQNLPWNEVPVDRLDDAEGFFGLEEISDVEVLRDSAGKIEYRVGGKSPSSKTKVSHVREPRQTSGDEEEWEGFEESDEGEHLKAPRLSGKGKATGKIEAKRRKKKDALNYSSQNTFEALGAEGEGAVDGQECDVSAWNDLGLSHETLSSLARLHFASPTAIQKASIPPILSGHDVIGKAQTGTGKSLAFFLPIYEHYLKSRNVSVHDPKTQGKRIQHPPIALILSPTRELAHQLSSHLDALCSSATTSGGPSIATLTGGLSIHKQQRLLANADFIIATPGRLGEILNSGETQDTATSLKKIRFLVVDEADRLLSDGHFNELEEILLLLDREEEVEDEDEDGKQDNARSSWKEQRQTLVFSATFQKDLQQKLAGKSKASSSDMIGQQESLAFLLKKLNFREEKPKFIDVNPVSQMASNLTEGIVECAGTDKDLYLYSLLLHYPGIRILIFTNSITSVRRLTQFLQALNLPAHPLTSQMPQKSRLRSLERFSSPSPSASILIATDVAARGLDIPSVGLVVHYHLPRAADMYVHRSGRTARAEKSGSSVLLCAPEEVQGVRRLLAKVHARHSINQDDDGKKFLMRTIELDRRVIDRLRPRTSLGKRISDTSLAKEKKNSQDTWLKTAAEDLGVDYDSEEFAAGEGSKKGRGQGRKKKEKEARGLTKADVGALKAELKELLSQRVNVGVSEKYLSAGGVDVNALLEDKRGEFLGRLDGGIDDL